MYTAAPRKATAVYVPSCQLSSGECGRKIDTMRVLACFVKYYVFSGYGFFQGCTFVYKLQVPTSTMSNIANLTLLMERAENKLARISLCMSCKHVCVDYSMCKLTSVMEKVP